MTPSARVPLLSLLLLCTPALSQGDLTALSDEFDDPSTISNWQRIYEVEQWGADQLEVYDFSGVRPGWLRMVPYTSVWYQDWRGVLAFKEVTGDFVATTHIQPRNRAGTGAPGSQYSLAGIMIRTPRNITRETWTPMGENYVFLSIGAAGNPGVYQFEVKTTVNSDSQLTYIDANTSEATIRSARIGDYFIMLRRGIGEDWVVHRRYFRDDMPDTLQVGMTCYTDWPTGSTFEPYVHNQITITTGSPDLVADFDYYRFNPVVLPPALTNANLLDEVAVPDSELLAFLGESLGEGVTPTPTMTDPTPTETPTSTPSFTPTVSPTETATLTVTPSETAPGQTPTGTLSADLDGTGGVDARDLLLFLEAWRVRATESKDHPPTTHSSGD